MPHSFHYTHHQVIPFPLVLLPVQSCSYPRFYSRLLLASFQIVLVPLFLLRFAPAPEEQQILIPKVTFQRPAQDAIPRLPLGVQQDDGSIQKTSISALH